MDLLVLTENILEENRQYLREIDEQLYAAKKPVLSNHSIGYHTRHVLEHLQCLIDQSTSGVINYDLRRRKPEAEESTAAALEAIEQLLHDLHTVTLEEELMVEISLDENVEDYFYVKTSFERELLYNLEHIIHHNSLIRQVLSEKDPKFAVPSPDGLQSLKNRHHQLLGEE